MAVVAIAGPAMNFFLAWAGRPVIPTADALSGTQEVLQQFLLYFMLCNLVLGLFNLLPIPPLDGGRIRGRAAAAATAKIWARLGEGRYPGRPAGGVHSASADRVRPGGAGIGHRPALGVPDHLLARRA